ncbi:hypothetical protein HF1_05290 [Mycoplasma haemofelis str. Langford 1]|uniref:Uncharacterized protein n=1 Tax=Mycoplasma haemofelis (strain Langford 1) TaxID=941640 RepID=E8ZHB6_MYCHL|nr:hypothetical protein [Mycoplasma haemofelis]CBY92537.1 hypothetical protein HF1_05290 [Mycoplasma haemofelis str. Langford 1]
MAISKPILGTTAALGAAGTGALAYKFGAFEGKETPITVKQQLKEKGYELIGESKNARDQWKTSFNAFKSDSTFLTEINKHTENNEALTKDDNGEKGKAALEKLCSSYLEGSDSFGNASKWCVLRIQDKSPTKGWLPLVDGGDQATANQGKWKASFNKHKSSLSSANIAGIITSTTEDDGYVKLKEWCSTSLALPFNKERQSIFENASSWCSESTD